MVLRNSAESQGLYLWAIQSVSYLTFMQYTSYCTSAKYKASYFGLANYTIPWFIFAAHSSEVITRLIYSLFKIRFSKYSILTVTFIYLNTGRA